MAPLDFNSLFTNAPPEETINICVNELFKSNSSTHGLNKKHITKMLSLTTKEWIILIDMAFYTQVEGVAMGFPLLMLSFFLFAFLLILFLLMLLMLSYVIMKRNG